MMPVATAVPTKASYHVAMAYDEILAARVRELLGGTAKLSEKRMFGGLAFLIGGNMAVAVSHEGGLLVRVDPLDSDKLSASGEAAPMVMRGREMPGWLRVGANRVDTGARLARWVDRGVVYAGSPPVKG
jgi:TfoX/Sxy family transcriptional regulator of competence genes